MPMSGIRLPSFLAATVLLIVASPAMADESTPPTEEKRPEQKAACAVFSCVAFQVVGGAAYRRIFDSHFTGADLRIAIGGAGQDFEVYAYGSGMFAATEFGLRIRVYSLGAMGEYALGRLRLGAGLHVSYLAYTRATNGDVVGNVAVGAHALASVDAFQIDPHGVFVGADLTADWLGKLVVWGPTGLVGFRF
jgi:hypothetical protein